MYFSFFFVIKPQMQSIVAKATLKMCISEIGLEENNFVSTYTEYSTEYSM
jgi:hypothetical protein